MALPPRTPKSAQKAQSRKGPSTSRSEAVTVPTADLQKLGAAKSDKVLLPGQLDQKTQAAELARELLKHPAPRPRLDGDQEDETRFDKIVVAPDFGEDDDEKTRID